MKDGVCVMGVDPDLEKCGWAIVDAASRRVTHGACGVFDLIDMVVSMGGTVSVFVEGGWLVGKSNFHGFTGSVGQRIAKNVGENHAAGKLLVEGLKRANTDVHVVPPLKKCWKGANGKITKEELDGLLKGSGFDGIGRCNQDTRDAVLLALTCSKVRMVAKR